MDGIRREPKVNKTVERNIDEMSTYKLLSVQESVVDELATSHDNILSHSPL